MSAVTADKKMDFSKAWPVAQKGIEDILNEISINFKQYMTCYQTVFNLAIAQHEEREYISIAKILETFVKGEQKKIFAKKGGPEMLKEYLKLFIRFTKTAKIVAHVCNYIQRYWIPGNLGKIPQGVVEVRELYPLALVIWRKHCFDPIKDKLVPSVLDILDSDRAGDPQDKTQIRDLVSSYIEFDKVGPNEGQVFYEKEFETRYLDRMRTFYMKESTDFLATHGVSNYLKKAEARIAEEKNNNQYLGTYASSSEPKIKKAIDDVLIIKHMETLQNDFLRMLSSHDTADMKRVYDLLSRVPNGLPTTADTFNVYLRQVGSKIVADQKARDIKAALENAVGFVKSLVDLYSKYSNLVEVTFQSHDLFQTSLKTAMEDVMNQDSGAFNIPRLLNSHLDSVVRGKDKDISTDQEMDDILGKLVMLFSYLKDKDEFFEYFRKALCKRLLARGTQWNENAEEQFLSKLKLQSGGDVQIRKLQGMFNDVQKESLETMSNNFEKYLKSDSTTVGGVDLNVQVLNETHWPISAAQMFPLILGKEMRECENTFSEFYKSTTEMRRLQWLYNYGTVTLNSRFTNQAAPVQLILTPLQASILVCFNKNPKRSFTELLEDLWPQNKQDDRKALTSSKNPGATYDMSLEEILKFAIQPLVFWKFKVLAKEKGSADDENISNTDVFRLRDRIPAKRLPRKIPFPPGSAKQQKKEADDDQKLVYKQREFEIEAAMVRVMKSRNVLSWQALQNEVINFLSSRFQPDPKMLKKRLESLLERKFMGRDEDDYNTIKYIA